jgi:hypothetical protein
MKIGRDHGKKATKIKVNTSRPAPAPTKSRNACPGVGDLKGGRDCMY